jgi:ribosome-binding factor A
MDKSRRSPAAKAPSQRQLRAGELIRHALVDILAHEELREPDLEGVSVTVSEVRMSPDMKHANAFVAPLGRGDAKKTAAALNRIARFLRGRLGRQIELRYTPELKFMPDESFDAAEHISALLHRPDIARDLEEREDDGEDD